MLFTKSQINYFARLPAAVARALPRAINPDVPLFMGDPTIDNYELIRMVWLKGRSIKAACEHFSRSRAEFYRLERAFVAHGLPALFPLPRLREPSSKLERLVLLSNQVRPRASEASILRLALAIGLKPSPSLRTIAHLLHCHGLGSNRDANDREFWKGIQLSIKALLSLRDATPPPRSASERSGTFYQPDDPLHLRFELFRELALDRRANISRSTRRYGVSRPVFYKFLRRFRTYGPWGLVEWNQAGRARSKLAPELELGLLEEKLEHPSLSLQALIDRMRLRCSRNAVHEVLKYWGLTNKAREPIVLRGLWDSDDTSDEAAPPRPLLQSAKQAAQTGQFVLSSRLNAHFARLLSRLKSKPMNLCDPGPIILAQFIDDLGVCEALQLYGPERNHGGELTNLVLLNICRILAGYETVNHLDANGDRSVAIAAGFGCFPGKTALYEGFGDLRLAHLQNLRNDVAARSRDLQLIRGERLAQDFHFEEFHGKSPEEEGIGKGPNSSGEICPGFRPHVLWDLDTDVLINIAFCNGATRATTIVREFCEKNLYPIIDRRAIRELYMDSEYTSFPVIHYYVVDEFTSTDVLMCLKRNKRVDQLVADLLATAAWEPFGPGYEITGGMVQHETLPKPLHLVVKRKVKTGELRCFGTTIKGLSHREVLERYRLRWPIENGLKDLIHSYFIDHLMGKDPDKIEANFYCIQVARMAYENFLQSLDENFVRDSSGYKKTLASFRSLMFSKHNCELRRRGNRLELTYLDTGVGPLQEAMIQLLERRDERGLNRVSWWGGLKLSLQFKDQFVAFARR